MSICHLQDRYRKVKSLFSALQHETSVYIHNNCLRTIDYRYNMVIGIMGRDETN